MLQPTNPEAGLGLLVHVPDFWVLDGEQDKARVALQGTVCIREEHHRGGWGAAGGAERTATSFNRGSSLVSARLLTEDAESAAALQEEEQEAGTDTRKEEDMVQKVCVLCVCVCRFLPSHTVLFSFVFMLGARMGPALFLAGKHSWVHFLAGRSRQPLLTVSQMRMRSVCSGVNAWSLLHKYATRTRTHKFKSTCMFVQKPKKHTREQQQEDQVTHAHVVCVHKYGVSLGVCTGTEKGHPPSQRDTQQGGGAMEGGES